MDAASPSASFGDNTAADRVPCFMPECECSGNVYAYGFVSCVDHMLDIPKPPLLPCLECGCPKHCHHDRDTCRMVAIGVLGTCVHAPCAGTENGFSMFSTCDCRGYCGGTEL